MRMTVRSITTLAVAALALGCGERGVTSADQRAATPRAPRLVVGPASTVTVACATKLETSTSGPCIAFAYDTAGKYTGGTVSTWSSSNTSVATISSGGTVSAVAAGTATISATVGGITGTTSVTVVAPPPPPPDTTLTVSISGPSSIRSNTFCPFYANPTNGTGPYEYSWTQSTGSGLDAGDGRWDAKSTSNFTLTVHVTDANGKTGNASKSVTVSSGASVCPV
jgi:hypothetical protein